MGHLSLVTAAPRSRPTRDAQLLKTVRRYLLLIDHLHQKRSWHREAHALAMSVLAEHPDDPEAAALWDRLYANTPAFLFGRGIQYDERRLAELLDQIIAMPAKSEAGVRAKLSVWRTVLAPDDADRLLDSALADTRMRRT
jgi:hypothetical protein